MPARNYRDLTVWKKAFELGLAIYEATSDFPIQEGYGITAQLRRACISIPSNIAEGEGRKSSSEFRRDLFIALGSLKEAETQVLICESLGYPKPNKSAKLMELTEEIGRLLNGLLKSLAHL